MIFKTIQDSVDSTKTKLLLFNKDWNTYKKNWQNANGFKGKVGSIFTLPKTNNSVISNEQVQILRSWNNVVKHGCTNQETFNRIIANADDNTKMYFAGLNKGKGSIEGLKKACGNLSLASKAAALGMQALSLAGNMVTGMLISLAVSKAVEGIYNLIHADEQAIEASNNAKEAISNLKNEMQQSAATAEEAGQNYAQLAQGVNQINNTNMSLSTDEYEKFLDLSNQLAELFPTLIRGYDDQGNAILNLGGSITEINEKIQTQIDKKKELASLEQYQVFMGEGVDEDGKKREEGYYTGAKIKVDDIASNKQDTENELTELQYRASIFTPNTKLNNQLKEIIADKNTDWGKERDNIVKFLKQKTDSLGLNSQERTKYDSLLKEFDESDEAFTEDSLYEIQEFLNKTIYKKQQNLNGLNTSLKQQNAEISQNAQVVFERSMGYNNLSDNQKPLANKIFNNIQWDTVTTEYGDPVDTEEEAEQYIQDFASKLSKMDDKELLTLDKLFSLNYEDMPIDEAENTIEQYLTVLSEKFGMTSEQLKDFLGFGDFFKLSEKYDNVVNYATESKGFNKQDVIDAMNHNGINTDEEISKFKELLDTAKSLEDAVKSYKEASNEVTDTPKSFNEAWNSIDATGTDEQKSDKQKLLELAEAGKLTEEALKNTSLASIFNDAGVSIEEATEKINRMKSSADQLTSLKTGISSISNILGEKRQAMTSAPTPWQECPKMSRHKPKNTNTLWKYSVMETPPWKTVRMLQTNWQMPI